MFRGFDPDADRLVAIKLFTLDLPPERVHRLAAELERLLPASLTHAAIAAPIAAGIHDNHAYLVQGYATGESLDVVIRHGAVAPGEALRVALQLAGALDHAAAGHVAHGALHPRDVLLTPEETRLTGLGIARAFERAGVPAPIRRPYTPPECIGGRAWDHRADIFSVAAILHELIWGRRLAGIGARAAAALPDVAGADCAALHAAFARALAEDPAGRFDTALEFAECLAQAFRDVPPAARRPVRRSPAGAPAEPRLPLDDPNPGAAGPQADIDRLDVVPASPPPPGGSATGVGLAHLRGDAPSEDGRDLAGDRSDGGTQRDVESEGPAAARVAPRYPAIDAVPVGVRRGAPPGPDAAAAPHEVEHTPAHAADSTAAPVAPSSIWPPHIAAVPYEPARSAIWPLALALIVGAALGFGGGYFLANYERASMIAPPAAASEATAGEAADRPASTLVPPNLTAATPAVSAAATEPAGQARPPRSEPASREDAGAGIVAATAGTSDGAAARPAPSASEVSPASAGRLLVRSTPAGARVFVDGRDAGTTPLSVDALARGAHRIRVMRDGYATVERRITIADDRAAQTMAVSLAPARPAGRIALSAGLPAAVPPGRLTAVTRPAGARVFIDDAQVGTTPLQVPAIAPGAHTVRFELDGFRRWVSTVEVKPGDNRVAASLEQ
ncbi:MAG: PEGA domain-containing protein [Acidobacteria bacterium]|nr:PEGA domain-containing protein [Acidobacteriota bacterium]